MLLRFSSFLILVMSMSLSGCGLHLNTPLVNQQSLQFDGDVYGYVIVGMGLGEEGNIDSMSSTLWFNGEVIAVNGVADRAVYKEEKIPSCTSETASPGDILRINRGEKRYRVWVITEEMMKKNRGKGLLHLSAARTLHEGKEHVGFCKGYLPTIGQFNRIMYNGFPTPFSYPSYTVRPLKEEPWEFIGNSFSIDKPGVYYLGDISMNGYIDLSDTEKTGFAQIRQGSYFLFYRPEYTSDLKAVENYLQESHLASLPLLDKSSNWKTFDGLEFYPMISLKK